MTLSLAIICFGGLSLLMGSLSFVLIGAALDAAELRAHRNMRAALRDMEGGKL